MQGVQNAGADEHTRAVMLFWKMLLKTAQETRFWTHQYLLWEVLQALSTDP